MFSANKLHFDVGVSLGFSPGQREARLEVTAINMDP